MNCAGTFTIMMNQRQVLPSCTFRNSPSTGSWLTLDAVSCVLLTHPSTQAYYLHGRPSPQVSHVYAAAN